MLKNFASGDWLYVLLGLIWLGVSVYKSSQKKTENRKNGNSKSPRSRSYFDTLLQNMDNAIGDILPEPETESVYSDTTENFDEKPKPVEPEIADNVEDNYETLETDFSYDDMILQEQNNNHFDATKSIFRESLSENSDSDNIVKQHKKEKRLKIDIRKAFIYDVVLNPPSY
jgi:hypothetical protein